MKSIANLIIFLLLLFISQIAQSAEIQPRIIGGLPADDGEWPATVGLLLTATYDGIIASGGTEGEAQFQSQFCGGTLLTPKWVLTAAHCIYTESQPGILSKLLPSDINVLAGVTDLFDSGQRIVVTNIIDHPSYNPSGNDFDIALLELAQDAISPAGNIALFDGDPSVGSDSTVVGWGTMTNNAADFPRDLQEVVLQVVSQADCNAAYGGTITDNMICAAAPDKDSCQGDSGGPLMAQKNGVGNFLQIGIVSFGQECALPGFPGVYTRVDRFSDWIRSFTESIGGGPEVIIASAPVANSANQTTYPVSGTCTAGDGNITVSIAGATPPSQSVACTAGGTWSATFDVSTIADGTNVIDVNASQTDAAGNTDNAPMVETNKDATAPVVETTSAPIANSSNQIAYPVSGTCSAGDSNVTVSIAGATPPSQSVACTAGGTWSATFDVSTIADGTNVIKVNVSQTDVAGNTGNAPLVEADKDTATSGGGGGAIGWLLLPMFMLVLFRRRVRSGYGQGLGCSV